jgi:hypothetical protein
MIFRLHSKIAPAILDIGQAGSLHWTYHTKLKIACNATSDAVTLHRSTLKASTDIYSVVTSSYTDVRYMQAVITSNREDFFHHHIIIHGVAAGGSQRRP